MSLYNLFDEDETYFIFQKKYPIIHYNNYYNYTNTYLFIRVYKINNDPFKELIDSIINEDIKEINYDEIKDEEINYYLKYILNLILENDTYVLEYLFKLFNIRKKLKYIDYSYLTNIIGNYYNYKLLWDNNLKFDDNFLYEKEMFKFYNKFIKKNNDFALIDLANYYWINKDYINLNKLNLNEIKKSNIILILNLGNFYFVKNEFNLMLKLFLDNSNHKIVNRKLGDYYYYQWNINKTNIENLNLTKEYYKRAIKLNDILSIVNYGNVYRDIGNIKKMKKYYNLGIKFNCPNAMFEFGFYYKNKNNIKNNIKMLKYFDMGINLHSVESIILLSKYYNEIEDYKMMEEYLLLGIKYSSSVAMVDLAKYYIAKFINEKEKRIKIKEFCYLGIKLKDLFCMYTLGKYYNKIFNLKLKLKYEIKMIKFYKMAFKFGHPNASRKLGLYYYF